MLSGDSGGSGGVEGSRNDEGCGGGGSQQLTDFFGDGGVTAVVMVQWQWCPTQATTAVCLLC